MPEALTVRFLHGEVDPRAFRHADHVRVAFDLLRGHAFPEACVLASQALKDMAARAGNPGAYHETITIAFLALIGERVAQSAADDFEAFAAANPDLFDKSVLTRWYAPERLASSAARRSFVLPEPLRA
jgi:hypothetical protein